jgi:hypothetical protein
MVTVALAKRYTPKDVPSSRTLAYVNHTAIYLGTNMPSLLG